MMLIQETKINRINLALFDLGKNKIISKRILSLSDDFAGALRDAVINQYENHLKIKKYKSEVKNIYRKYTSEQLAMSNLVNITHEVPTEKNKKIKEKKYDYFGYGTNKAIPRWIYKEIHNPKLKGVITKDRIPLELLRRGVTKCTYSEAPGKNWTVVLYKEKK